MWLLEGLVDPGAPTDWKTMNIEVRALKSQFKFVVSVYNVYTFEIFLEIIFQKI